MITKFSLKPFVKTIRTTPILVNPLVAREHLTAYLDWVRTQLQQAMVVQDIPDAFDRDDNVSDERPITALDQQHYIGLENQAEWLTTMKTHLQEASKIGVPILLLSSAGAVAMYGHQKGWLKRVGQRLLRRKTSSTVPASPVTDLTAFVRDLAMMGTLGVKVVLTTATDEPFCGPLAVNTDDQFVLVHPEGNLIFAPEAIQAVATILNQAQAPETIITITAAEQLTLEPTLD